MGGSSYDVGVGSASSGKSYSDDSDKTFSSKSNANNDVLVSGERRISTEAENPIVIALDVTGSMGDSAKIMFDKMPMFWGQMEQKNYLKDPAVSFAAIGDAYCDTAPLQVTDFEKAKAIHPWLQKIWLEGGGGGQTYESYELAALFYITRCSIPNCKHGFFFFIGDEGFYPEIDGKDSILIFKKLMEVYDTFFIHWPYDGGGSDDTRIVKQWRAVMGERLLILKDPKAIVDVMLGLIAMLTGVKSMSDYEEDLKGRGQSASRIKTVKDTLKPFTKDLVVVSDNKSLVTKGGNLLPNRDPFRRRT